MFRDVAWVVGEYAWGLEQYAPNWLGRMRWYYARDGELAPVAPPQLQGEVVPQSVSERLFAGLRRVREIHDVDDHSHLAYAGVSQQHTRPGQVSTFGQARPLLLHQTNLAPQHLPPPVGATAQTAYEQNCHCPQDPAIAQVASQSPNHVVYPAYYAMPGPSLHQPNNGLSIQPSTHQPNPPYCHAGCCGPAEEDEDGSEESDTVDGGDDGGGLGYSDHHQWQLQCRLISVPAAGRH